MRALFRILFPKQKKVVRARRFEPDGVCYNLKEIYHLLNQEYFEGKLNLQIGWFGSRAFIPKYQIRFGYYNPRNHSIRIHRWLDRDVVPSYFVSFIVYHEMLHHVHPPIKQRRKRQIHHRVFKTKEREFKDYALVKSYLAEVKKHVLQKPVLVRVF